MYFHILTTHIFKQDVIEGAFDSGVSREAKTAAWESIAHVLRTSFAESKPRSVEELKKKWNNLKTAAKKDIGLYANSLKGTGKYFKPLLFAVFAFC